MSQSLWRNHCAFETTAPFLDGGLRALGHVLSDKTGSVAAKVESSEQGAWGNFHWRATVPPFMLVVHTFKFTNEISFSLQ